MRKDVPQCLAKLPSLKAVRLPVAGPGGIQGIHETHLEHNVGVVKYMQEVLGQAGVMVEAVPLWQVDELGRRLVP